MLVTGIDHRDVVSRQRSRLYRVATLATGVLVYVALCWTLLSLGRLGLDVWAMAAITSGAALGFALLALAIVAEWNLMLEDPDMSLVQMLLATTIVMLTGSFATEMQPLVVCAGLALVVVGAHRLSRREIALFILYSFGLFALPALYEGNLAMTGANPVAATDLGVILLVVAVLVFIGPLLYRMEADVSEAVLRAKDRELALARSLIDQLQRSDALTGVLNRRSLLDVLGRHKAMATRRDYTFAVCHVELERFAALNQAQGQAVGDELLRRVAELSTGLLREVDCVARIGAEEFVLVLGGTTQENGLLAARRISEGLKTLRLNAQPLAQPVTAAIGVAEYRPGESIDVLLSRAGRALAEAHYTGKGQITLAEPLNAGTLLQTMN
jgi:diguanylate cyclase (GGDEF)-like protein